MNSNNAANYLYQPECKKYLCDTALSKINDYLGKGQVNEAFELVASSTVLTVTEIQALEITFFNSNLNVGADAEFKGVDVSDFKPHLFALLIKAVSNGYRVHDHIWELLNNSLLKVSDLGHHIDYQDKISDAGYHHLAYAQGISAGNDDSHYWVVTTSYKVGDNEGVHTSLVSDVDAFIEGSHLLPGARPRNLNFNHEDDETFECYPATVEVVEKIIGYQEAYKFSGGIFKIYKRKPAFVLDGFISQPKEIRQVTADEYEILAEYVQSTTLKWNDKTNSEVNKALKYVLAPFAEKLDCYPLFFDI
ncbi:hypothetical protein EI165_14585 [Pseudoalteromonas nigrifaciens]|uniref:hypothetical protein n=1 Tax=Pseudoalteromonas nigrifaciens TaxID=28109 RepID=UPI0017887D9D|nr:hypothetical protein [Pseudoalteromonas nigrifaciens]MBE0421340.1 hypothetical protein [Pseudoalteromonas nigrifaciens]